MSYLALAIVAGLAGVERKGFLQAMLSRPVAIGPLVGLALGDVGGGVVVGALLELLWLGAVNLGAALPVHEALGAAAITGGAVLSGEALGTGVTPAVAALAFVVGAPLAVAGRAAERGIEALNDRFLAVAERRAASTSTAVAVVRVNVLAAALPFALAAVLAPLGAAAAAVIVPAILRSAPAASAPLAFGAAALAAFSCASGAFAIRSRSAPAVFLSAAGAASVAGVALLLAGGP